MPNNMACGIDALKKKLKFFSSISRQQAPCVALGASVGAIVKGFNSCKFPSSSFFY